MVNQRIKYKLLSITYKVLTTAQLNYLHNLISLQPPLSTHSSSVVNLSCPPTISLKITDRSFRYASPRLWNQLPDSCRQSHHYVTKPVAIHTSICLLIHLSTYLSHHSCSRHPSLLQSFTPGSKPTFSTNPSHLRFLLHTGLPHDNGTGPDRTYHAYHFIFSFTF